MLKHLLSLLLEMWVPSILHSQTEMSHGKGINAKCVPRENNPL